MTLPEFDRGAVHPALVLHDAPDEVLDVLRSCDGLEWTVARAPDEVVPALERARPSVVFSIKHSRFPGEWHARALAFPTVRWFHVGGSGRDHLADAMRDDVVVTGCRGVLAPFLAERAMAALLQLTAGMRAFGDAQRERVWAPTRFESLEGRMLLVVGAGAAGTELARRARAFGMRVVGVRASGEARAEFDEMHGPSALPSLWSRADVVSVHVPLTEDTRGLVGERELAALPDGAIVMNSSRGAVLDEDALVRALERNVAGAWLDVFTAEPLPTESSLWAHPRVVVTPHCADQVADFPRRFAERFRALWNARP